MNKEQVFQFLCSADDKSGYLKKEMGFKKNFPELYAELITWNFPKEFTFQQKIYHYLKNDSNFELGLCLICGNRCKFINLNTGYLKHCSLKCSGKDEIIKKKISETNFKRYGVENYSSTKECRNKVKTTNLEKYGVENYSSLLECRNKVNKTKMDKYGDKSYNNRQKAKETCLERYNVENYSKTDEYKKKVNQTCLEKYGHKNYIQTDEFKYKSKQTCLERYGSEQYIQTNEYKEKTKETCLEKYGSEYYTQTKECRERIKQTCLKKYGVENYSQTKEWSHKRRKKIKYDNLMFDSNWEVIVYKYCKENNIPCEYQPNITFEYLYNNEIHQYHPDFLINGKLYEVKGNQFFYNNKMINPYDRSQDELYEAKHQCIIKNDIIILNGDDIKKIKERIF